VAAPELSGSPRFSVVVPTRGRRDLVLRLVRGLAEQQLRDFEAIVVVDGPEDGTAEALRALEPTFRLTVVEQPHRGAAAARNTGAAAANGEILLFLDDDMAPHPALLAEHDRSQREGAEVVLGHLPLDPSSPPTAVAAAVGRWAERRRARLTALDGGEVPVPDLISGQISVRRDAFERLGGFDVAFTRGGLVPGADRDFGYRARRAGLRVVFNPAAISAQRYTVDAREHTRRSRDGARGDRILAARYPEIASELWEPRFDTLPARLALGPLAALPRPLSAPVRALAVRLFSRRDPGRLSNRLFFAVQTMERRRGAREGQRELEAPLAVVLAYHSISSLAGDRILGEYGTPPEAFARQLDRLSRDGWHFVGLDRLLEALDGSGTLPERAVLLTFDDGYVDLLAAACPILASRGIPAVVFAVAERIGGTNEWRRREATELQLLDAEGLRQASAQGVVVASHGATHRPFVGLPEAELERELTFSADRIASLGLPRPTVLSYPHGEWSAAVAAAVARAGYRAAFTVTAGAVRHSDDRYALPRIEVRGSDTDRALARRLRNALARRRRGAS
jgi:peptidoglycan/xylan/chitin deacetylase (PgdA/CDA1 family)/glycosyltransferase involved in cell wall biosynthesis